MSAPILAASTGLQAYSAYREGIEIEKQEIQNAYLGERQAREIERRSIVNARVMRVQGSKIEAKQLGAVAASGFAAEGSSLAILQETSEMILEEQLNILREAEFEAAQIRRGGEMGIEKGRKARELGGLKAGAYILKGLGDYYSNSPGGYQRGGVGSGGGMSGGDGGVVPRSSIAASRMV